MAFCKTSKTGSQPKCAANWVLHLTHFKKYKREQTTRKDLCWVPAKVVPSQANFPIHLSTIQRIGGGGSTTELSPVWWRWDVLPLEHCSIAELKPNFTENGMFSWALPTLWCPAEYICTLLFSPPSLEAGATNCAKRNLNTVRISFTFSLTKA